MLAVYLKSRKTRNCIANMHTYLFINCKYIVIAILNNADFPIHIVAGLFLTYRKTNEYRSSCLFEKKPQPFPRKCSHCCHTGGTFFLIFQDIFNGAHFTIRSRCTENLSFLDFVVFSSVVSGKLGALRLKVRLVEDRILPSVYYQPLIHLLVESVISPTEVCITIFLLH